MTNAISEGANKLKRFKDDYESDRKDKKKSIRDHRRFGNKSKGEGSMYNEDYVLEGVVDEILGFGAILEVTDTAVEVMFEHGIEALQFEDLGILDLDTAEQIDELSKDTLKSYFHKAQDNNRKSLDSASGPRHSKKNILLAKKKIEESEEVVDIAPVAVFVKEGLTAKEKLQDICKSDA